MGATAARSWLAGATLIAALAIPAALVLSPGARAGGAGALLPDLVTLALGAENLRIVEEDGRTLLRLSNEVANAGAGPLEVFPSAASTGCDGDSDTANDRGASQRLFADTNGSGAFERGGDGVGSERYFGCLRYHPAHDHWHTLDFSSYELRSERSGRLVRARRKVGFCLADYRVAFPAPDVTQTPHYPSGSQLERGCDSFATQGLSVGWADVYTFAMPGQEIAVGGLRRGRYCLTSRTDPRGLLEELDEDNNVRRVRIVLRPRVPSVRKLDSRCRI